MSEEIQKIAQKRNYLKLELEAITEQLNKVKKDNLCIRMSHERWRQTYESLKNLKKNPHEMEQINGDQEALNDLQA